MRGETERRDIVMWNCRATSRRVPCKCIANVQQVLACEQPMGCSHDARTMLAAHRDERIRILRIIAPGPERHHVNNCRRAFRPAEKSEAKMNALAQALPDEPLAPNETQDISPVRTAALEAARSAREHRWAAYNEAFDELYEEANEEATEWANEKLEENADPEADALRLAELADEWMTGAGAKRVAKWGKEKALETANEYARETMEEEEKEAFNEIRDEKYDELLDEKMGAWWAEWNDAVEEIEAEVEAARKP